MGKKIELNLPNVKVDNLFTTQEEQKLKDQEKIIWLSPSEISAFPNHPFKVQDDEAMRDMIDSIKQNGVLSPVLVRSKEDDGYEMIAGHRRQYAAINAEISEIPCIVRNLTDDESIIVMVDSNLQREKVLPSEKAFAYKMKLEAMSRQGQRSDLTSTPLVQKLSVEKLGEQAGESRENIRRYIRLTELVKPILEMVDNSKIAFRPAVELSYLPKEQQESLFEMMEMEDCTPSLAQAIKMKKFSQEGKLSEEVILSILQEEKPNQKEQIKISKERLSKYFQPGTPAVKMEETIIKALEMYRKRQKNRESER